MYSKGEFGQPYQADLKRLSKELLAARNKAKETFLHSDLQNGEKCWTEFYKYVKRHKGNRENIWTIKDHNGSLVTDPIENAKFLNLLLSFSIHL